ncbi:MAG: ketoacyl-ACP synthase III [Saprospiraceae bacterium]
MRNAYILASGAYAPEQVFTNQYFDELLGVDVSTWLEENVQIFERRWCAENESTADLAEKAARQALEKAGMSATELDLIIIATDTPEFISPSTASVVQHRLGASHAGTFDINTACAGFVTALDMAAKYIRADENYNNILVIGAYAMSKYLNKADKKTVTLFADGAGAVILKATDQPDHGFLASELLSKGEYHSWMGIYGGGTRQPVNSDMIQRHEHQLQFVQKFPPELNPEIWSGMIQRLSDRVGISPLEAGQYFITQININAIHETLHRLHVPIEKGYTIMHRYGYTGSACIPMAFHEACEKGLVKSGETVYFVGSGGGLAFAGAVFRM